jgi:hypothetical protein
MDWDVAVDRSLDALRFAAARDPSPPNICHFWWFVARGGFEGGLPGVVIGGASAHSHLAPLDTSSRRGIDGSASARDHRYCSSAIHTHPAAMHTPCATRLACPTCPQNLLQDIHSVTHGASPSGCPTTLLPRSDWHGCHCDHRLPRGPLAPGI